MSVQRAANASSIDSYCVVVAGEVVEARGYENWLPVVTFDVALDSVVGAVHMAPPSFEADPVIE